MIGAMMAQEIERDITAIPWDVVPMVFLGLIAVIALFGAIYWAVGKMGIE